MNTSLSLAAILRSFATPADVVVEKRPRPEPAPGELLLAMHRAPINPADLNVLEGKYGELPTLPSPVGNEGVGQVVALGEKVTGWEIGDIALPMQRGTWVQHMCVPAATALRLPRQTDPAFLEQAAMLMVNPATAWLLLREIVPLREGEWIVQNAANSGVGRCVMQLAKSLGVRVLSVVRRAELLEELAALDAGRVVLETEDLRRVAQETCGSQLPRLGLNAVGGASALQLCQALAPGGTLVTFGAMSKQPLKIPNGLLIFRDLVFRGFWLTRWLREAAAETRAELYRQLAEAVVQGRLHQPVAQTIPLHDLPKALALAAQEKRSGKILLDLTAGVPV